ncbi:MAG: membrane dipeptidase [Sedimentisphaerales bacterium]|nr:membrane dipeptidase [Sedimentisphaerales bacterium]
MNRRSFLKTSAGVAALAGTSTVSSSVLSADTVPSSAFRVNDPEAKKRIAMNENIQKAREAALKILKPGRKELEHGLELHANSVVVESYGFSPVCALDGDKMRAAIEANASPLELKDLKEDMHKTRCVTDPTERQEFMDAFKASGVTCILQNAGAEGQAISRLIKRLAYFTYITDMMRDFIFKAVTPDDIVAAKKQNKHCLYLSGNGVPLPQDWVSVEEELRYIRIFFQLGIRMMHLTYNRRNMIGDGCAEPANGGLSDFGRAVVAEMNRVGVIVDVAHCGWQTSLEAAQVSERPIVASHTVCGALNSHIRSKPDNVIRAIAEKDGLIGICCIPSFLGGKADVGVMLDHIDYAVKTFGAEHVAIGTDVAYLSRSMARERKKIPRTPKSRNRWAGLWPEGSRVWAPKKILTMAWTNWPLFTVGLVQRGYSDSDIQKILGGNVLRVARAVLS